MTKKSSLSKAELEDLKAAGYVEGNKHTIPENLNPVLKSKLLADLGENSAGNIPGVPAPGNEEVQQAGRHNGQQDALTKTDASKGAEDTKTRAQPFGGKGDHDNNGVTGSAKPAKKD